MVTALGLGDVGSPEKVGGDGTKDLIPRVRRNQLFVTPSRSRPVLMFLELPMPAPTDVTYTFVTYTLLHSSQNPVSARGGSRTCVL